MKRTRTVLALVVAAVLVVVTAGAATAGWLLTRDAEVADRGSCEGVTYELSVEREDEVGERGHEISYELQSAAPGETWSIAVEQGGTSLLDAERTTDEDGEIDLDVLADPAAGQSVTVSASRDGRVCDAGTRW